jgi:predicted dehydrogenase
MDVLKKILIIGAGPIAGEYSKICRELGYLPTVIGRGLESAKKFTSDFGIDPLLGGISAHKAIVKTFQKCIVATSEDTLDDVALELIELGIKEILIEKPGSKNIESFKVLAEVAKANKANVYIGYNRRFYQSVLELKKQIEADGGLESMVFEFTEWGHVIESIQKNPGVKENWLWHNSSHVIDLAFHIAGPPKEMSTFKKGALSWHPKGEVFVGSGITNKDVLFSYHANWGGPGRWGLEFITRKNRYYLKPLEELQVQIKGTVRIEQFDLENENDKKWKPGYLLQTSAFLDGESQNLVSLSEQLSKLDIYNRICKA